MSNQREIKVTVTNDGAAQIDFAGYIGKECLNVDADLRRILLAQFGIEVEETSFTPKPELELELLDNSNANQATNTQRQSQSQG
jgi:hypothetical protein